MNGPRRIPLDFLPEIVDERVDRPRRGELVVSPDLVEDHIAADDFAFVRNQKFEQPEFFGR